MSRPLASRIAFASALVCLLSGAVLNPWTGRLWRGDLVDYRDVMQGYAVWSLALGLLLLLAAGIARRSAGAGGPVLLLVSVSALVLADRLLLVVYGLPLWVPDPVLGYRHRPNAERSWARFGFPDSRVRINAHGHHDDAFPEARPEGELRILALGDSITMGHGMAASQSFPNQLEDLLRRSGRGHRSYQVINTAVQGYSPPQEYRVLVESLRFSPDAVLVGFCMNDVTEPLVVEPELGGVGLDYHGVVGASSRLAGLLLNETGAGRALQAWRWRGASLALERRRETYNVRDMASRSRDDPLVRAGWDRALAGLERIYAFSTERGLRVDLLIFPYAFQLWDERLKRPQAILSAHAEAHGVEVLDFTPILARAVLRRAEARRSDSDEGQLPLVLEALADYFVDDSHLSAPGHELVARELFDFLVARGVARARGPGG